MPKLRLVLFDVDGVLLDSLTPHLKICEDKNKEYGLGLKIPGPAEFKKLVRTGVRISPMKQFFRAMGFPEEFAEKANLQYQQVFMRDYAPAPFPRVHEALRDLHDAGLEMGIVTSNVMVNIVNALGPSLKFFDPNSIYTEDHGGGASKHQAISSAMTRLHRTPAETIYVGDQPADFQAAKIAGVNFLGVTYGWGISEDDHEFPIVSDIQQVSSYLRDRAGAV